ncbi:MAG: DUF6249 domain-containing protein [Pseudomonadota bacterium]
MKNLIVAFAFTTFSLMLPMVMAQQAVAQEVDAEVATEVQASSDAGQREVVEEEGRSSVVINYDSNGSRKEDDEIQEAIEEISNIFGDSIGRELKVELSALSDRDREKLGRKLEKVFDGNGIHVSGGGIGAGEVIIALVAICLTLGLPVIILVVILIYSHKKRRQMSDLANTYIAAEQPMPEHVMAEFGSGMSGKKRLRSGLTFLFVGAALALFFGLVADPDLATLGLIPMAIGAARLIYWKIDSADSKEIEKAE